MLVLGRNEGQTVMIGNEISVTVLDISSGNVRLGISAPKQIEVHRKEVFDDIRNGVPLKPRPTDRVHPRRRN